MCLKRIHFSPAQISANLTKLESDFITNGGQWEEFRLGSLFEVHSSKKIFHANQIKQIYEDEQKDTFPYMVRSTLNNGIRGYINENKDFLNPPNTLSFAQDTFSVFYQDKPYFTGNKVKVLIPRFAHFNKTTALFIVAIYQKSLAHLTWGVGSTTQSIQEINIKLPTQEGKIAFDFMESFIKELELERIKELEAYLQATGLNNYKLTDKEKQTLDIFTNSNSMQSLEWQEFKIGDV